MRRRLLHVGPLPPPVGGMATNVESFLRSGIGQFIDIRNIRSDLLGKHRCRGLLRVAANLLNAVLLIVALAVRLLIWRPDIVHVRTNSFGGFFEKAFLVLMGRVAGCRTILHVHGGAFEEFWEKAGWIGKKGIRWSLAVPDRVIALSQEMRCTLCKASSRPERIEVIENAVFVPPRTIWDVREESGSSHSESPVTILFLNRIEPAKGIWEFVEALGIVLRQGNACVRIVGPESGCGGELRGRIDGLGLADRVRVEPAVQGDAKAEVYLSADIYVLPSHVEGMPLGLLEAMSYGLACIATPVGAVPSVIDHDGNGLLVPLRDPQGLADAISRLTEDGATRRRLGLAARQTIVDRYSWDRRAKEYVGLYERLLGRAVSDRQQWPASNKEHTG